MFLKIIFKLWDSKFILNVFFFTILKILLFYFRYIIIFCFFLKNTNQNNVGAEDT